jgi:hypothetical protein
MSKSPIKAKKMSDPDPGMSKSPVKLKKMADPDPKGTMSRARLNAIGAMVKKHKNTPP